MKIHLALNVRDIDRAREFYSTLFNSEPVKVKADYLKYEPHHLPVNIAFNRVSGAINTDQHLGLMLEDGDDLDALHERLLTAGLIDQPRAVGVCCYARQDKFWLSDPDGHAWEVYKRLEDTAIKDDNRQTCCAHQTTAECCE